MSDHYDRLETRTPSARESALFRDLRHVLGVAKARVPSLRAQLKGIDVAKLQTRADLATIPLQRLVDIAELQRDLPPLGGLVATRTASLKQLFVGPGPLVSIEGQAKDWWGAGRALFAAGLRRGSLVLNCFPYDLAPQGHMITSGANAINAPIIPAGNSSLDDTLKAVQMYRPTFFCGSAALLKELLDFGADCNADMSCLARGLVTGPMLPGRRNEFGLRGLAIRQVAMSPELGVVAFESGATDGMTVNEGLIVEIVDPATGQPVAAGVEGEVVVTRINPDYPLIRFATGEISSMLPQMASCGRTNMRIRVPRPANTPEKLRIDPTHLQEIKTHHPFLGRMCLFVRRPRGCDIVHLKAEHRGGVEALERVSETLHLVTRMRGTVEFVEPGSMTDDEGPIIDERPLN